MSNEPIVAAVLTSRIGSIVAPAGCGKTDCIADVVKAAGGPAKCLVLTHTLAGVDSLRQRLKEKNVSLHRTDLETIAGWSLRFAAAFPQRSGLGTPEPRGEEWPAVYAAATQLIRGGFVTGVLKASYQRVLVDEYQDCTIEQHALILALSQHLPTCIFGDPLQAIFGFRDEQLADWRTVTTDFPKIGALKEPWRWKRVENAKLGDWLIGIRDQLEKLDRVDLTAAPRCVSYIVPQSSTKQDLLKANISAGRSVKLRGEETLIVIGDKASELIRASLAAKLKCSAIEPVACQTLGSFLEAIENCTGRDRLALVLNLAAGAMSGLAKTAFERRAIRIAGGWKPRNKLSEAERAALDLLASNEFAHVLRLLECLRRQPGVVPFRRELLSAVQNTLKLVARGEYLSLADAAWHVQNKMRHAGRRLAQRSIGSTLLVKGLQFDHAIIVAPEKLSRNDLYVALTRASRTITVVSASPILNAKVAPAEFKKGS
ncbi:RNA helicase [Bradyrhizobium sp. CCBAU 11445]|uniref:UvrD-helicase domain-containing protein n=1 Tax=unclassified Bradyrhizobium TaxID=2631580 RepID=UPI0023052CE7|nr:MULTISPECIES: UvrD-helicase domain-containing protein [unclassified Bradyrhizobium]MDA9453541.1 RNA helicase [Bradyrhizobium sp. CCBAU 21359]MDA9483302.1 RNA helicase [Bradyrhizobium sp. CCBAU 11445]MDA9519055.1 RNA helicase [Bradyrhizobium sp. CCBAU 11434]